MAQLFEVHPDNPPARLLKQAVDLIQRGGIAAVPTTPVMHWFASLMTRQHRTA